MPDVPRSAQFTRRELVTLVRALEDYEVEMVPPRRDLAARVEALLSGPGDVFVLHAALDQEATDG